ncbi:MAG TPA: response regulator transcription factor [Bacillota bacterium]|nr:response regulator transcription factor [Bacillota bacterium]HOL51571.1 response regulator transcription factor [Bacillota bacterium]HPQ01955.1 response regulator transcription factor [Bacillota bacterium]HPZ14656.1 response regulator transcription factor [Bacillota bacterium]HQD81204.1 response regulator transcription factor [Bacillota bacterium]
MTKVLLADDEARMRRLVSDFLKREGFVILEAENGREALDLFLSDQDIELVILDVMMPGMDGWVVCREIRRRSQVPIIMLTARAEESDQLFGFDIGADEYITEPFSPMILVARAKALLRRTQAGDGGLRHLGLLEIDEGRHVVSVDGERLELSPKEFELLVYFADNANLALSRDQILSSVWDYDYFGDARTVDTHVKRLRAKLGPAAGYIETVRGIGYRFEATEE